MSPEKLFTLNELAEYLKVTRLTAFKLVNTGQIKAKKVGREWRIKESEVDKYLSKFDN